MGSVAEIFQTCADQAAGNIAPVPRRRLVVALAKLHVVKGDLFPDEVWNALTHIFPHKKSVTSADSVVRLLDAYLAVITNEADRNYSPQLGALGASLAVRILKEVMGHYQSQAASVRFRAWQVIATIVNHVTEMEDFVYRTLMQYTIQRIRDKDFAIRKLAVTVLCKLQSTGVETDDRTVRDMLLKVMRFEPKADSRRVTIVNIDINADTFPSIIQRVVDKDVRCRIAALRRIQAAVEDPSSITLEEREFILYHGLSDRELAVRNTAVQLLEKWSATAGGALALLRTLDVSTSRAAELVANACVMVNPTQKVSGKDIFEELDPAFVLYLRVAIEYFNANNMNDALEEALPALGDQVNAIMEIIKMKPDNEEEEVGVAFCAVELLKIAIYQDFSDEVGRRMFIDMIYSVVADTNCNPEVFSRVVAMIPKIFTSSREYISKIEELLAVLLHSRAALNADVNLEFLQSMHFIRCLLIADNGLLRGKQLLYDIVDKFINVALESEFEDLQLVGCECLALAALIDKKIADESLEYFLSLAKESTMAEHPEAYVIAFQYLFDSVVLRGTKFLGQETIKSLLDPAFDSGSDVIVALATGATAKMVLMNQIVAEGEIASKMREKLNAQREEVEV